MKLRERKIARIECLVGELMYVQYTCFFAYCRLGFVDKQTGLGCGYIYGCIFVGEVIKLIKKYMTLQGRGAFSREGDASGHESFGDSDSVDPHAEQLSPEIEAYRRLLWEAKQCLEKAIDMLPEDLKELLENQSVHIGMCDSEEEDRDVEIYCRYNLHSLPDRDGSLHNRRELGRDIMHFLRRIFETQGYNLNGNRSVESFNVGQEESVYEVTRKTKREIFFDKVSTCLDDAMKGVHETDSVFFQQHPVRATMMYDSSLPVGFEIRISRDVLEDDGWHEIWLRIEDSFGEANLKLRKLSKDENDVQQYTTFSYSVLDSTQ